MRANAFPITLRAIRPNRSSLAPPLHHHDFYPSHPPPSELFARPNFRVYRVYRGFMDKKRFDRDPEGKKYLLRVLNTRRSRSKVYQLVCYFPFFTITHLTASSNPKIPPFTRTNYYSDETIIDLEKRKNI